MLTRRTATLSALAAMAACAPVAPPAPPWRAGARAPYPVQEIYPALHDGAIWIAGGFSPPALGATRRVIALDVARGVWLAQPHLAGRAHHVHLASLAGALHAVGGFLGGATHLSWICTPRVVRLEGEDWGAAPDLPKPVGEAAPVAHEDRIHLIGGRSPLGVANSAWEDHGDIDDHFVLAAGASHWERAAPLPLARNSAACAALDGAIHVISGRTVAGGPTPAHHIYDAREDRWRDGPPFPDARGGLAAATLGGRIICGGGESDATVSDALFAYDDTGWSRFETLPTPRHGYGLVAADDALYALGGASRPSGSGTLARVDVLLALER